LSRKCFAIFRSDQPHIGKTRFLFNIQSGAGFANDDSYIGNNPSPEDWLPSKDNRYAPSIMLPWRVPPDNPGDRNFFALPRMTHHVETNFSLLGEVEKKFNNSFRYFIG
jgi:hypothetical protein